MPPSSLNSSSRTVSVIVPTYHRPDALRETLAALVAVDYPRDSYELIVVDDGVDEATASIVERFSTEGWAPRLLRGEGRGAATARNRGAEAASNELLLFCDDDVIVEPAHLNRHVEVQTLCGPCMCAGFSELDDRVRHLLKTKYFGRYWLDLEDSYWDHVPEPGANGVAELRLLSARNLCLPRSSFQKLAGFDESFPYAGAEDQDLSIRGEQLGLPRLIDHRNHVRHLETRLDFPRFCQREERSAHTYAILARKFPESAGRTELATLNDPANAPGTSVGIRLKKAVKRALGGRWPLRGLHAIVRALERVRAPDPVMRRVYAGVIGVHIAKGFRDGLDRPR
jgi:glycosyltransferase involved in cell wall biosynthesis